MSGGLWVEGVFWACPRGQGVGDAEGLQELGLLREEGVLKDTIGNHEAAGASERILPLNGKSRRHPNWRVRPPLRLRYARIGGS